MSKKQGSILNFVLKTKGSKRHHSPSLEENVDDPVHASGSAGTSSAFVPTTPTITSEVRSNDIGSFLNRNLSAREKHLILSKCWVPDNKFKFPLGTRNLKFQKKWMLEFHWLLYSKFDEGAFCKYCFLFAKEREVGKGQHIKLG